MKALIIGNWKIYPKSAKEAKKVFDATKKAIESAKSVTLVVAPPTMYLRELIAGYRGKKVSFACQHVQSDPEGGAYTGDVSIVQAKDAGASYVIVGHSERRAQGETNAEVQKKVAALIAARLTPVVCVGESSRTTEGDYFGFVREQIRAAFALVPRDKVNKVIVAYEPVWAIGGETAMSPRDMHEMAIFIRKTIAEACGIDGLSVKIIYGGSVNENNAVAMLKEGDVVGLLPGHVSVDPVRFAALLKAVQAA